MMAEMYHARSGVASMIAPKPLPVRISPPKGQRRPHQGKFMTLAAAFRSPKGGILLCADREWNDAGISKREVDKLYRINLASCVLFLAGAGPDTPILRACEEIHRSLSTAEANGVDVLVGHAGIVETALQMVHKQFARLLKNLPMTFLVVIAPRSIEKFPALYYTDGAALIQEPYYYAVGSGKPVADYLADRLYEPRRLSKRELATLAAFILREAGESSLGVGVKANMVFIREGETVMHYLTPGVVKEIQDGIPPLRDAIENYWPSRINFPEWMGS